MVILRMNIFFRLIKYTEMFKLFFSQLIQPTSRVSADVYSYMFLCDFFNFFVLLLGYTSFGVSIWYYWLFIIIFIQWFIHLFIPQNKIRG